MIDGKNLLTVLLVLLPVIYAAAFASYLVLFFTESRRARRAARPLLIAAVIVDFVFLFATTVFYEHLPLVTVHQVVGGMGFAVAIVYLLVETRTRTLHTGPFILGLVVACKVVSTLNPKLDGAVPEILHSKLFGFHVSAAVLGYSAFAVAAVYGLLYLMLYHAIRRKSFGLVFRRLPSLDILDRMNFYAMLVGFLLLTVAMALGAYWSMHSFGTVWGDPKVVVAMITWALYGLALLGHQVTSWKGARLAYSSLLGFFVVVFSIFAVNYYLTSFHGFVS